MSVIVCDYNACIGSFETMTLVKLPSYTYTLNKDIYDVSLNILT